MKKVFSAALLGGVWCLITTYGFAASVPGLLLYHDTVALQWINYSFGGTFNLASPVSASGSRAIRAVTDPWGAVGFRSLVPESLAGYEAFEFSVRPEGSEPAAIGVVLHGTTGPSMMVRRTVPPGVWTAVRIPLSEFAIPASFRAVKVFLTGGNQTLTWYLDEVQFTKPQSGVEGMVPVVTKDTIPPSVRIESPVSGAAVRGAVPVIVIANDDRELVGVSLQIDGVGWGNEATTTRTVFLWPSASSTTGRHNITALARDAAGNRGVSQDVVVYVERPTSSMVTADTVPPTVTILSPRNGDTIEASSTVLVAASDDRSVNRVELLADGKAAGTVRTPPYLFPFRANGTATSVTFTARAIDASNNIASSTPVRVRIILDTEPPHIVFAPSFPVFDSVTGTVALSATASDNVGVQSVQFKLDGTDLGAEDRSAPYSIQWDTTKTDNGTHTLYALAKDAAGNIAKSGAVSVSVRNETLPPDTIKPFVAVTGPSAIYPVSSTATLTATATDNVGVVGVRFKLNGTDYGSEQRSSPYRVVWNTSESDQGSYAVTAVARDAAGNVALSAPITFRVTRVAPVADSATPTITLTAPLDRASVTGTVALSATASDNVGVQSVQFKLDGTDLGAEDRSAPYSIQWDTTKTDNGTHTLYALAKDAAGNIAKSGVRQVYVQNPPSPQSTSTTDRTPPQVQVTVLPGVQTGTVKLSAGASDAGGVAGVQFKLDGTLLDRELIKPPFELMWDTTKSDNGLHRVSAVARDAAGNFGSATPVSVTVSNVAPPLDIRAPEAFITEPVSGATLSDTAALSVSATDDIGVTSVQFKLDGTNFGAALTKPPFTVTWDTKTTLDGIHRVSAVARDAAGNHGMSNIVSVIVANPTQAPDRIAPTITLTAPLDRASVTGTVALSATASDNVGVQSVQFKLDGTDLGAEDRSAPYSIQWDTTKTDNGTHTLYAYAKDAAGNIAKSGAVSVVIKNPAK